MRISDWSSDVCSSDLLADHLAAGADDIADLRLVDLHRFDARSIVRQLGAGFAQRLRHFAEDVRAAFLRLVQRGLEDLRSEEHTSELQSLMRISYAVFCLKT